MEKAIRILKGKELRIFNKVRLYLQVATLSDVATANGICIDSDILEGRRGTSPSPSRHAYKWPLVPSPSEAEQRSWTDSICAVLALTRNDRLLIYSQYRYFEANTKLHSYWNYHRQTAQVLQKERITNGRCGQ